MIFKKLVIHAVGLGTAIILVLFLASILFLPALASLLVYACFKKRQA